VPPLYVQKVLQAVETETVYTSVVDGPWPNAPYRALRNSTLTHWEASGSPPGGARPGYGEGIASRADGAPITRSRAELPGREATGGVEAMTLYAGQSTGLVSRLQSAHDIVKEMADEAIRTLEQCVQFLWKDNAS
jgi:NAD(P)H-dependent flavin oxidoreductase YrpB (nitropropane dioxygenase family)